jgi:hypothetical protein
MKKLIFLIILLCSAFLVHCATEHKAVQPAYVPLEKCDAPIWNVGDSWRYSRSDLRWWEYRVEKIDEDFYIIKNPFSVDWLGLDKKTLELKNYINSKGNRKKTFDPTIYYFDFPIYVGKKWAKTESLRNVDGIYLNYLIEFKVISYEDITIPAGKFKAFKIEHKMTSLHHMSGGNAYIWFSPEVKNVVKVMYENVSFWVKFTDYELTSFKLVDKLIPQVEKKLSLPEKPQTVTQPPPPSSTSILTVTGTSANIRSGAGNEFPITTTVKKGDRLILIGEYGEWFNVRLENGQEGWINNSFAK